MIPRQTASNILTAAGFQVVVQQGSGPAQYAAGTVFAQQPASGNATKGSKVTIFVQQAAATPSATPSQTPTPTRQRRSGALSRAG